MTEANGSGSYTLPNRDSNVVRLPRRKIAWWRTLKLYVLWLILAFVFGFVVTYAIFTITKS